MLPFTENFKYAYDLIIVYIINLKLLNSWMLVSSTISLNYVKTIPRKEIGIHD